MNCRKAAEMILNGETDHDLEEHLVQCKECAGLLWNMQNIRLDCNAHRPEVPERLDRAVLSFAAEQIREKECHKPLLFSRFAFRICVAAAMLIVCTVLGIVSINGSPAENPAVLRPDENPVEKVTAVTLSQSRESFLDATAEMDTELLTLALSLDQTESDLLTVASAAPSAWYSQTSDYEF